MGRPPFYGQASFYFFDGDRAQSGMNGRISGASVGQSAGNQRAISGQLVGNWWPISKSQKLGSRPQARAPQWVSGFRQ
jgi:hypothetical protein